jgi:hypothetical protein
MKHVHKFGGIIAISQEETHIMKVRSRYENGQAIVLLVISLVVLLGFTALALDGGMVYSDRRVAQNAADTAALAGGGAAASGLEENLILYEGLIANCNPNSTVMNNILDNAVNTAIARAETNSFTINRDTSDGNYATAECVISGFDRYIKVRTSIVSETRTSFAHLLYNGPLRNTVEAETIIYPTSPLFYGNSIVALRRDVCPGVEFRGTSDVELVGGGVYSNSCIYGNGNIDINVTDGSITYMTTRIENGHPEFNPTPAPGANYLPDNRYPVPNCNQVPERPTPSQTGDSVTPPLQPGRYAEIRKNSGSVSMEPGLYCITGDFYINTNRPVVGHGVTIYSATGNFYIGGGAVVDLTAPSVCEGGATGCPPALDGMLIYMGTGDVTIMGSGELDVTGTIYAPEGDVYLGGTPGATASREYHVQVIGGTVTLRGTPGVQFVFNEEENVSVPANLNLYK